MSVCVLCSASLVAWACSDTSVRTDDSAFGDLNPLVDLGLLDASCASPESCSVSSVSFDCRGGPAAVYCLAGRCFWYRGVCPLEYVESNIGATRCTDIESRLACGSHFGQCAGANPFICSWSEEPWFPRDHLVARYVVAELDDGPATVSCECSGECFGAPNLCGQSGVLARRVTNIANHGGPWRSLSISGPAGSDTLLLEVDSSLRAASACILFATDVGPCLCRSPQCATGGEVRLNDDRGEVELRFGPNLTVTAKFSVE